MGLFDKKSSIIGTTVGASIGSGQKWSMADSLRLGAAISALDVGKEDSTSSYAYSDSSHIGSNNEYDDLILTSEQEEQLEKAGIDTIDFECMDDDEKMEALEEAGLDPFDFDMY